MPATFQNKRLVIYIYIYVLYICSCTCCVRTRQHVWSRRAAITRTGSTCARKSCMHTTMHAYTTIHFNTVSNNSSEPGNHQGQKHLSSLEKSLCEQAHVPKTWWGARVYTTIHFKTVLDNSSEPGIITSGASTCGGAHWPNVRHCQTIGQDMRILTSIQYPQT